MNSPHKYRFRSLILLLLLQIFASAAFAQFNLKQYEYVMPRPASISINENERFVLDSTFGISFEGIASEKLIKAVNNFYARLLSKTHIKSDEIKITGGRVNGAKMTITAGSDATAVHGMDESYKLNTGSPGIELTANTDIGAMRGLETILQLVYPKNGEYRIDALRIEDSPRFPWRGLMMDVCRHFLPLDAVKRNIDGMAAMKLNVFHWHLSEDQGFRVECKTFPKLHEQGSDGNYFTREQVKDVIKYANDRGIRVVPEFDIPGHSTAWFAGYPEYASAPDPYEIERHYGVFDPTFDPTNEKTYEFFDLFFKEMSELFNDEYIHIGGDENNGKQWNSNPQIQEFMKANNLKSNHELQAYFNKRIQKILKKYGKKMVGWDEIQSEELPKSIVIHSWRGRQAMMTAAKQGFASILSNGYYIDLCQSVFDHYYNDPMPADIGLNEEEKKFILGGEATMWAELVNNETVDSRIWPRTAAIAEVLWRGILNPYKNDTLMNKAYLYNRLNFISQYLETCGLTHLKNRNAMLRRLTNGLDLEPYRQVLSVVEPLKYYNRHKYRRYSQFTPLTRLVDIATPDAPLSCEFYYYTEHQRKGESRNTEQKNHMTSFKDLANSCESILKKPAGEESNYWYADIPSLNETLPLVEKLRDLGKACITLLSRLEDRKELSEKEYENIKNRIDESKKPVAEVEITFIQSLDKLLEYVYKQEYLK
ncbi:MAG: family 20 glycosylhydrolase [Ignavibacteria bacterium]|nr:family 20 glycosylhydrolase [Ignavibacteria bacterium]